VVEAVLGPIIEVDARTEIQWPAVKLTDIGEESLRETADHVGVLGKTRSGAVFTANINVTRRRLLTERFMSVNAGQGDGVN
jgi:hypothetical protein